MQRNRFVRGFEHESYKRGQPENDVQPEEIAKIYRRAQLLIDVKTGTFDKLPKGFERVPLTDLNVRKDYVSEIEKKQELAVILERHGAPKAFVVLPGSKSMADLVDDVKIPLSLLHTREGSRGARALAVVGAAVREYGEGSVSVVGHSPVVGHSLGAAIAGLACNELAYRNKQPLLVDTHLFNHPPVRFWDLYKLVLCTGSSAFWMLNKGIRQSQTELRSSTSFFWN